MLYEHYEHIELPQCPICHDFSVNGVICRKCLDKMNMERSAVETFRKPPIADIPINLPVTHNLAGSVLTHCTHCGYTVAPSWSYCGHCGHKLP